MAYCFTVTCKNDYYYFVLSDCYRLLRFWLLDIKVLIEFLPTDIFLGSEQLDTQSFENQYSSIWKR